jgi:hypothetical protein
VKVTNSGFIIVTAFVLIFVFSTYSFATKGSNDFQGTVIFDFSALNGDSPAAYAFGGESIENIVTQLGFKMDDVISGSKERKNFLRKLKKKYRRGTESRWLSKEQDKLEVFVFYKEVKAKTDEKKSTTEVKPNITFEEKARKTRIANDLSVLTKLVVTITTKGAAPEIEIARATYQLAKRRANLTVTAKLGKSKTSKSSLVTGPTEHWFLSADLPVAKLSEVKFVQDKGTLEPRETPRNIHLGLNCMIGDILKERQNLLKNFFVKGMLKISKSPLDGYGVGIGYRFPKVRPLGIDISSFSIFAAVMWTKEETEDKKEELKKHQILFGIGYNLDKALGWVK